MEFYTLTSLVFLAILLWWYVVTRYHHEPSELASISEFDSGQLDQLIRSEGVNYYLIDVRPEEAYRQGHIPTAINIPARTCSGLLPTDDLFILVVVYGSSRKEAHNVAQILCEFGYFNVYTMNSIGKWKGQIQQGKYQDADMRQNRGASYTSI